jgi:hypothetical protein
MRSALWIGPAILAAAIAGLINIIGWFVTFRQTRRLGRERRAEKVTDVQTALLAEIRSDLQNLRTIHVEEEVEKIRQRLQQASDDTPYTPFVPKDSGTPIFSAIVEDIALLPTEVIDPVVLYYKQRDVIAHFTMDLRAESFRLLPADRKLAMMADYLRLKAFASELAADAVASLENSLGLPGVANGLNNRGADPWDRRSASAGSASDQASSVSFDRPYRSDQPRSKD